MRRPDKWGRIYGIVINSPEQYARIKELSNKYRALTGQMKNHFIPALLISALEDALRARGVIE